MRVVRLAANHPSFGTVVRDAICGRCRSNQVLVFDRPWSVHPYSGDAYWDFETRCTVCGAFNRYVSQD
jgi:hypothetical protein